MYYSKSSVWLLQHVAVSFLWMSTIILPQEEFCSKAVPIQLHGLNYNTRKGPDWDWDKCKARHEILNDLTILSRMTNRIRLLSLTDCGQAEVILDVAQELNMQLWLGLWVGPETFVFEEEKGELIGLLERGMIDESTVLGITVGSEAIYREDATVEEMIGYMNEIDSLVQDAGIEIPVTIVDIAPVYAANSELRSAVSVTMTNTFPFWEAIDIDEAIDDLQEDLGFLLEQRESRNKPFVLGETGWPSDGFIEGVGIASPDNQRQYFQEAFCRIDVENGWAYYWFTGIDNAWRQEQDPNNTIEGNWGFLYTNLTLKPHFEGFEFQCSDGVTYSFDEIDWSIPQFTAPPAALDPASCQANSQCTGLLGNCCPGDNGLFLGCCDRVIPASSAPTVSPDIVPTIDDTTTSSPTSSPTISPITTTPSPTVSATATATATLNPSEADPPTLTPSITTTPNPTGFPTDILANMITPFPMTPLPTASPTDIPDTSSPTDVPSFFPTTSSPTKAPSLSPTTSSPTNAPSLSPTTSSPTNEPSQSVVVTAAPTATTATPSETINPTTTSTTTSITETPTLAPTPKPSVAIIFGTPFPTTRPSDIDDDGPTLTSINGANSGALQLHASRVGNYLLVALSATVFVL